MDHLHHKQPSHPPLMDFGSTITSFRDEAAFVNMQGHSYSHPVASPKPLCRRRTFDISEKTPWSVRVNNLERKEIQFVPSTAAVDIPFLYKIA